MTLCLAASVLKIRHPRIAHELLGDQGFWNGIGMLWVETHAQEKEQKLDTAVSENVQKAAASLGLTLEEADKKEIEKSLKAICSHVAAFMGLDPEAVAYQVNVAEAPAAVTWKEFSAFLTRWQQQQVKATAERWITDHARKVDHSELDVYRELLKAAIQRYAKALHQADNVFAEAEKPVFVTEAVSLLALLNVLVFDLGHLNQPAKQIGDAELDLLVDKWTRFAGASLPVHADFWPRNEAFILALFDKWSPDVMPLIRILGPYGGIRHRSFDHNSAAADLHNKLCAVALPKFARQLMTSFREPGFVERLVHKEENTFEARCIFWEAKGPLWGPLRNEFLQVLAEAPSNRSIQSNAYEFLHWFVLSREGHVPGDPKAMQSLLSDQLVFNAVWNAAIATPLAPRAVYQLRHLPEMVEQLKIKCDPPPWWQQIAATFIVPAPPANPPAEGDQQPAPAEGKV